MAIADLICKKIKRFVIKFDIVKRFQKDNMSTWVCKTIELLKGNKNMFFLFNIYSNISCSWFIYTYVYYISFINN